MLLKQSQLLQWRDANLTDQIPTSGLPGSCLCPSPCQDTTLVILNKPYAYTDITERQVGGKHSSNTCMYV